MALPTRPAIFQQSRPIVDSEGRPTIEFLRNINQAIGIIDYLAEVQIAAEAAQAAADAAQASADAAAASAGQAGGTANGSVEVTALLNSYPTGVSITATDAGANVTVAISAHTRTYAYDPTVSVAVNAGNIPGLSYSTRYYIYYVDPDREGGAVSYIATTNPALVAQVDGVHSVGAVDTPAAAAPPASGYPVVPPGGWYAIP